MPSYVLLGSWTEEGIRALKQAPQRAEAFHQAIEKAGGKVLLDLHTMGPYDVVVAVELPSDEALNTVALRMGQQGLLRTTTLKGWTPAEFAQLVQRL
jgi:uncharacterized protein with GYD domain